MFHYSINRDGEQCLDLISVSQLYCAINYFIQMIEDGYYDFHALPIGLKKRMQSNDCDAIQKLRGGLNLQGKLYFSKSAHDCSLQIDVVAMTQTFSILKIFYHTFCIMP